MLKFWLGCLLGALAVMLTAPPPAHADMQSYVNDHGINIGTLALNPSLLPGVGGEACKRLHAGESAGQVASEIPALFGDGPGLVAAAQHELCPDTLR